MTNRLTRKPGSLRCSTRFTVLAAAAAFLLLLSACGGSNNSNAPKQPAAKEDPKPGASATPATIGEDHVEGTLTVNGTPITLKHVYALSKVGAFDESKQDIRVFITDLPIQDKDRLKKIGLMFSDEQQGLQVTIDEEKDVIGGEIFHKGLEHGYFSSSGTHTFEAVVFDNNTVEGKLHSGGPRETFGDKWEYSVTFKVKVHDGK
jgi:hypothetical protein